MIDPAQFYLGPPGRLQLIQCPSSGYRVTSEQVTSLATLLGGARRAQVFGRPRREFDLRFAPMDTAGREVLRRILAGLYGPPPYALIEPLEANLLPAVRSGLIGSAFLADFQASAGTMAVASPGEAGLNAMTWVVPAAAGLALLTCNSVAGRKAVPVIGGEPVAVQALCKVTSGAAASVRVGVGWYYADGTAHVTNVNLPIAVQALTSSYERLTYTVVAPVDAAFGAPVVATNSTTAATIQVEQWGMELGNLVSDWQLGVGVPRVVVGDFDDVQLMPGLSESVTLPLLEVGY